MGGSELLPSGSFFGGTHIPLTSHALPCAPDRSPDPQSALAVG